LLNVLTSIFSVKPYEHPVGSVGDIVDATGRTDGSSEAKAPNMVGCPVGCDVVTVTSPKGVGGNIYTGAAAGCDDGGENMLGIVVGVFVSTFVYVHPRPNNGSTPLASVTGK
jgi:hypothetical protein